METNYTKGEWTIEDSIIQENKHIKIKTNRVNVIVCNKMALAFCGTNGNKESLANAKLIAAAPEMFEAIQYIIADINPQDACRGRFKKTEAYVGSKMMPTDESIIRCIEAIKKATEK